jgi:hypothetical protein
VRAGLQIAVYGENRFRGIFSAGIPYVPEQGEKIKKINAVITCPKQI